MIELKGESANKIACFCHLVVFCRLSTRGFKMCRKDACEMFYEGGLTLWETDLGIQLYSCIRYSASVPLQSIRLF